MNRIRKFIAFFTLPLASYPISLLRLFWFDLRTSPTRLTIRFQVLLWQIWFSQLIQFDYDSPLMKSAHKPSLASRWSAFANRWSSIKIDHSRSGRPLNSARSTRKLRIAAFPRKRRLFCCLPQSRLIRDNYRKSICNWLSFNGESSGSTNQPAFENFASYRLTRRSQCLESQKFKQPV